jgi:hypothetical protein
MQTPLPPVLLCCLALLVCAQAEGTPAGVPPSSTTLIRADDRWLSDMSRYYLFVRDPPSSSVLVVDLSRAGGTRVFYDLVAGTEIIYAKAYLWWPGGPPKPLEAPELIRTCVAPARNETPFDLPLLALSAESRRLFRAAVSLFGVQAEEYARRWKRLMDAHPAGRGAADGPGPNWLRACRTQLGVFYQDVRFNELVLEKLAAHWPQYPPPLGAYFEYAEVAGPHYEVRGHRF